MRINKFRSSHLASVFAGALVSACGGGGGGGGASAGGSTPTPISAAAFLPTYNFSLSDVGATTNRLVTQTSFGGATPIDVMIDFRIEPTIGQYTLADKSLIFDDAAIAVEGDFGPMVVDIVEPMHLAPGEAPSEVSLEVTVPLEGLVRLRFTSGMVEMQLGTGSAQTIGFDEFEGLVGSQVFIPVWQRQSSLGWAALDLLRHLITASADSVQLIDFNLATSVSFDEMCDPFPGSPPAGALNQGMARLTWLGSGQIQTGDQFDWDFTSCWLDSPGDRDILLDGSVNLNGYTREATGGSVTRIGYASFNALVGGVFFDDLVIAGTTENLAVRVRYRASKDLYADARYPRHLFRALVRSSNFSYFGKEISDKHACD